MMALASTLALLLSISVPTTLASPMPPSFHALHKRSPSPRNIGIGFAIAISVVIFVGIVFYLGVQRGRTGTWFCWRDPLPCPPNEKVKVMDSNALKSRISSPIHMYSSALPELSPVEAQPKFAELSPMEAKPKFAELPSPLEEKSKFLELSAVDGAVLEMGPASPLRPPSVVSTASKSFYSSRKSSVATAYRKSVASVKTTGKSVYSTSEKPPNVNSWFDRKSWFCKSALEVEDEEKKIRRKEDNVAAEPSVHNLAAPTAAVVVDRKEGEGRGTMDWSGMEWLSKVYNDRKSKRLSGMRSFYIPGSDEK